jgi:hypothetical protein
VKPVQTGTIQTSLQVKKDWAAQEVLSRAEGTLDRTLRQDFSQPILQGLDRKLGEFEDALSSFKWPADEAPWFGSRLVTGGQDAQGALNALVRPTQDSTPPLKIASGGFDSKARTSLAPGSYTFNLSQGGFTETLGVDVAKGDTWGDVLTRVQGAVNGSPLAARADVVYQNASFQLDPSLSGTGSILILSVNPGRKDQDLSVTDVSGGLLTQLRMKASDNPIGPATEAQHQVNVLQKSLPTAFTGAPVDPGAPTTLALGRHDMAYAVGTGDQPQSYISKAYDPTQAATLAAGTYSFTSKYDGETRNHSLTVGSGWTWGDVMNAVAAEVNGQPTYVKASNPTLAQTTSSYSQPGVTASVDSWPIPSSTLQGVNTDGRSVTVAGAAGKDFTLADGSGGLLTTLGLTTKLTGTPVSFNVEAGDTWKDVHNSMAAALNGAQQYFTVASVDTAIPSTVTPGKNLWHTGITLAVMQQNQRIGERVNLSDGRTGALSSMGITANQRPGQDGMISVEGRQMTSENNLYSLDQGRVLLTARDVTGQAVPLSVTSAVDEVEKGWNRVTDAWNGLARYLKNNSDLLKPSLGAALEAPLAGQKVGLRWMGVSSVGKSGMLWTNVDAFWGSLSADAGKARATLADTPDGLVPAWSRAVAGVRAAGLESWLKPATAFDEHRPSLTHEFQLEQKHRLVKLLG